MDILANVAGRHCGDISIKVKGHLRYFQAGPFFCGFTLELIRFY